MSVNLAATTTLAVACLSGKMENKRNDKNIIPDIGYLVYVVAEKSMQ
jgi:hypothetical protein